MKLYNTKGVLVSVDVRPSSYPLKQRSRSSLQGMVGAILLDLYPRDIVLEEFTIPGSRMSLDYFLPKKGLAVEIQGRQHDAYVPHFHGPKNAAKFAGQLKRDREKAEWAETNGFRLVEIREGEAENDIRSKLNPDA